MSLDINLNCFNLGKKTREIPYSVAKTFTLNRCNRVINTNHLKKIKNEMINHLNNMPPILVNLKTGNIIDGQHRHEAYCKLVEKGVLSEDTTIDVNFINISEEEELNAIIGANINSKGWGIENFVDAYAKGGNENYIKLKEWTLKHDFFYNRNKKNGEISKIKYRYAACCMTGEYSDNHIKDGTFQIKDESLKIGDIVYNEVLEILDALELERTNSHVEPLIKSWWDFRGLSDFEFILKELRSKAEYKISRPQNDKQWKSLFNNVIMNVNKKIQSGHFKIKAA